MSELAKKVMYPDYFYYLLEFVGGSLCNVQQFYDRYPDLAGGWSDISVYNQDDLDDMDAFIKELQLDPLVTDHTKSVPDNDDAA